MGKIDNNKQMKRESLLDSAFSLFINNGFSKTSISDIVNNAGVAKGTFYLYFKDKYDIQLEDISTDDYAYIDYRISEKEQFSIYFFDTSQNILYYCYMINQNEMAKIENLG